MNHRILTLTALLLPILLLVLVEPSMAYEFESRTKSLTSNLISTVLPLASTLGLVYAAFLAVTGDASAKIRIITVVVCSIVGFLAPHFIEWLKMAAGA